ncbi:MAG: PD40 domain-containing protein [Bacteroidales bacterium]|nr:PD40 domain-containing protein [Bacteroidales bacterium]
MFKRLSGFATCIIFMTSCLTTPENATFVDSLPPIYPDYTDVTIPQNIAPLNFLLRTAADETYVTIDSVCMSHHRGNVATFDLDEWKRLMERSANKDLRVSIYIKNDSKWIEYKQFTWHVASDSVDAFLTYRLIEPDYEIYQNIELRERCVENFEERNISTYKIVGNRCMNCHTYANRDANRSMMYVRGENGGAILNTNGVLRKLDIKTPDMISPSVYFHFSPTGRYAVFSSNVIIPAFHSKPSRRLEVYDSKSDVYVADLDANKIISSPLLNDSTVFETFPTFSHDGRYIYFCTAPNVARIEDLQYSLCRIAFDETTGTLGTQVDTIINAQNAAIEGKGSVCHPKVSPDGKYLLYTVAAYGTFPIWHTESDLQMLDLQTGAIDTLAVVNSQKSDTYHSWSSNSRWFVFASKRDDGLYGKPYFCYVDANGKAHKPFVLPQESPTFYDYNLKSFNIPELGSAPLPFTAEAVGRAINMKSERFE